MTLGDIVSSHDWDVLRNHLLKMQPLKLERTMGRTAIILSVEPVNSTAWREAMIIGVHCQHGGRVDHQWFPSVESAKAKAAGWQCG